MSVHQAHCTAYMSVTENFMDEIWAGEISERDLQDYAQDLVDNAVTGCNCDH